MPRLTDSDQNRFDDERILFAANDECPTCGLEMPVVYVTEARDEDGLADLSPGDVTAEVTCPAGHPFTSVYEGYLFHGEAG